MDKLLLQLLMAFAAGAVLMLILSFTLYRRSYYYEKAMVQAGARAEGPGVRSRMVTVAILLAMILFFALFDLWVVSGEPRSLGFLAALNLGLVALLSLFDALFIDLFLLVIWRPALLHLPEGQPTRDSMLRHVRKQFTVGWIFKVPIAILGAALGSLLGAGFG